MELRSLKPAGMVILAAALAAGAGGCRRHKKVTVQTVEEMPALSSVVATADPQAAMQLVSGFYGIEQNAWRWTAPRFSVALRPPRSATANGATLQMRFTIPDVAMPRMKGVALSAYVAGTALPPETYNQAGTFTYSRDVPGNLLNGESVRVDFAVDKTMAPTAADRRELGLVVLLVGFQPK